MTEIECLRTEVQELRALLADALQDNGAYSQGIEHGEELERERIKQILVEQASTVLRSTKTKPSAWLDYLLKLIDAPPLRR